MKNGTNIKVKDSTITGTVCGFGTMVELDGEIRHVLLIKLDKPFWNENRTAYITIYAVDLSNAEEYEVIDIDGRD